MGEPRMTLQTLLVLRALLDPPGVERYGREMKGMHGLASGTVQPILARLQRHKWATSRWEKTDPGLLGRPPRRYYRLTRLGITKARKVLADQAWLHEPSHP